MQAHTVSPTNYLASRQIELNISSLLTGEEKVFIHKFNRDVPFAKSCPVNDAERSTAMKLQINNHGNGLTPMEIYKFMVQENFSTATVMTHAYMHVCTHTDTRTRAGMRKREKVKHTHRDTNIFYTERDFSGCSYLSRCSV